MLATMDTLARCFTSVFRRGFLVGTLVAGGCPLYVREMEDPCREVECGERAMCSDGVCQCQQGYDGDPDDVCTPAQEWWIVDACEDGRDIAWRLFAQDRDWAWPSADAVFETPGDWVDAIEVIGCVEGEAICFGAQSGNIAWGVGLEGDHPCTDCCYSCGPAPVDLGYLECD